MAGLRTRLFSVKLWFLWLRHSYKFRWAHRPLCSHFSEGIIRIGNVRLCRSCVCAYCGIISCAMSCLIFSAMRELAASLLIGVMVPTIGFSMPPLYKRCSRLVRDLLRFCMGCCCSLCFFVMLIGNILTFVICASVLLLFWRIYFIIRRQRRIKACNNCVEFRQEKICTGCQLQADTIRAYETQATILLNQQA